MRKIKCPSCGKEEARYTKWDDELRSYYGVYCESCGMHIGGFDSVEDADVTWKKGGV